VTDAEIAREFCWLALRIAEANPEISPEEAGRMAEMVMEGEMDLGVALPPPGLIRDN